MKPLQVLYSPFSDQLAVSEEGWNMVAIVKFVFYFDIGNKKLAAKYLMLPDVAEKTEDWEVVGEL